jgi:hypothetical protein
MKKRHRIDALFILLLYGMFALLSMLTVVIGIQVYKDVVTNSGNRGDMRAALSYVANRFRAADTAGGISLETRNGVEALVLQEQVGNYPAETLIYYYDGALREYLYVPSLGGQSFAPAQGDEIVAVAQFSVTEENGLFTIASVDSHGEIHRQQIYCRTS